MGRWTESFVCFIAGFFILFGIFGGAIIRESLTQKKELSEKTNELKKEKPNPNEKNVTDNSEVTDTFAESTEQEQAEIKFEDAKLAANKGEIRVILNNSDYTSYKHDYVDISSENDFYVTLYEGDDGKQENKEQKEYKAGSSIRINPKDYKTGTVAYINSELPDNKFIISSISRSCGKPLYRGNLEIRIMNGFIYVINVVNIEDYLQGVISSEVPASYEEEAEMALAVCARGYAMSRILDESYSKYNADLDDSTKCQMYNSVLETPDSVAAVQKTKGIVALYENKIVTPFYFSTSAGVTCTATDIWGGQNFGYLKSSVQSFNKEELDLSKEVNFKNFIADFTKYDTIEKDLPYFRWKIFFSNDELKSSVKAFAKRSKKFGNEINKLEDIDDILIKSRAKSGVILEILIIGKTKAGKINEVLIFGEDNIRAIFSPKNVDIELQDKTIVKEHTKVPSPFYYIEKSKGGFTLFGGGFGHGVGLSQNGANELAKKNYDYKFILKYYFNNISFGTI